MCLTVYVSVCLSICLRVSVWLYMSVCLTVCASVSMTVEDHLHSAKVHFYQIGLGSQNTWVCLTVCLSVCLCVCLTVCVSVSMTVEDHLHSAKVHFYQIGLGAQNTVTDRGWKLMTLRSIQSKLGHTKVWLTPLYQPTVLTCIVLSANCTHLYCVISQLYSPVFYYQLIVLTCIVLSINCTGK